MFNKTFLITGGTGSWGEELVKQLLVQEPKEVRIFSRNESLQAQMRQTISDPRVRFVLGDIRDRWELAGACKDVDYVFHLAALKHVPVCEDQPDCAVKTNITGTQNVIDAAIENGVRKVVYVSTDKAANPSSMYGMTKAIGEKLILLADSRSATSFTCVRSGNVLGSTGSVVPLFKRQLELEQPLSVTDSRMTRFFLPLGDAVEILLSAMEQCEGGEIIVPRMPSCKITDIAQVLAEDAGQKHVPIHFIGARPGERLYETLISDWENVKEVEEEKSYFVVTASSSTKLTDKEGCETSVLPGRGYHSEDVIMTKAEVRDMLWRGGFLCSSGGSYLQEAAPPVM
ncbi:polysaccharide biosynthesis protein [Paenibacillus marchantiae]|uniref:polysaccharide biosynthesis protein n=1 Tax=Paenibacillus marchantiae TaxID=3026433 RepID=UPI00237AAA51|nr:polysaccharide biosynthesis protein [Paenibacillus marchantiae]WDQ34082.1 polysaccharide biosynthesis protein [Paenibacillus marchantiae]